MAHGTVNTHISRPTGDVFAVIADVSKNARWASSSVEGRQTSSGPVDVGTTAREVSTFLGRRIEVDSVVTEFIDGRRLAYRTTGGPFPFSGAFDVAAEGDGARVTATFDAAPAGVFRVARATVRRARASSVRARSRQPEAPDGGRRPVANATRRCQGRRGRRVKIEAQPSSNEGAEQVGGSRRPGWWSRVAPERPAAGSSRTSARTATTS